MILFRKLFDSWNPHSYPPPCQGAHRGRVHTNLARLESKSKSPCELFVEMAFMMTIHYN